MLKWLTDWGWFCFAGGWRRVASRHRWSETKMIKMVWRCLACRVSFFSFLFLFLLMDLMDVDLWLILADYGWFCIQVPRRCFWTTPSWLLAWTLILLEITHGFNQIKHCLSLLVIDCHVSFVHICPYLPIFVHICPCSSLFIPVPICDFPCSLKVLLVVAVSTSQRVGGRRLLWPTVSLRCEVGAQDGRQARRQIPVGALDTEKVAENISRNREIENQVDRDRSR